MFSTNTRYWNGISDFYKMVVTVTKTHYKKQKPKPFKTEITKIFMNSPLILSWTMSCRKLILTMLSLKSLTKFFLKFLISMLQENRNILEPIILIILQKLLGKKLCTDLDFATNFWESKQMVIKLPITNDEIFA